MWHTRQNRGGGARVKKEVKRKKYTVNSRKQKQLNFYQKNIVIGLENFYTKISGIFEQLSPLL